MFARDLHAHRVRIRSLAVFCVRILSPAGMSWIGKIFELRHLRFASAFWVLSLLQSDASINNHDATENLVRLAEWVRQTGRETVVRAHILAAMDLPAVDKPSREC